MSLTFAIAAVTLAYPQAKPSSPWKRYEMKPLHMSAEALKKPSSIPFRLKEGGEEVKVNLWLKWESGSLSVLHGFSENKDAPVNLSEAANGGFNGMVSSRRLKVISRNSRGLTVSGLVAMKFFAILELDGERIVYNTLLAAKGRKLWQTITMYAPEGSNHAMAERCLASVKLKP